jgi:hypothetical protein
MAGHPSDSWSYVNGRVCSGYPRLARNSWLALCLEQALLRAMMTVRDTGVGQAADRMSRSFR